MKREIKWFGQGKVGECLVTPERRIELENFVQGIIEKNGTARDVINALNERGDLTDNEWTATMFGFGYWQAKMGF